MVCLLKFTIFKFKCSSFKELKPESERLYKLHCTLWQSYPELGEINSRTGFIDPHLHTVTATRA